MGTPAYAVPIICGTMVYYMIDYVKSSSAALKGVDGIMGQITMYIKHIFQNKAMWVVVIAFIICLFVVYTVRRMAVDHAWKFGIVAGAVVNIVVIAAGDMVFNVSLSYPALIGGSIGAILIGLILELLFFSVDYSRSESLQYEDDEYYYFVKAIPKIVVAAPEKTVKRINKREERQETEIIDTEEIRKKTSQKSSGAKRKPAQKTSGNAAGQNQARPKAKSQRPEPKRKTPQAKSSKVTGNTEHLLLTQSLRRELNLDDDDK